MLPSPSDQPTRGGVFFFSFLLLLLEDSKIGGFKQVGVIGGFEMLENSPLYKRDLLRGLSLQQEVLPAPLSGVSWALDASDKPLETLLITPTFVRLRIPSVDAY